MSRHRWLARLGAISMLLPAVPARAAVEFAYSANADPTTQGWTADPSSLPSGVTLDNRTADPDLTGGCPGDCPYWEIFDDSTGSGTRRDYLRVPSAAQLDHAGGWALRARMRRIPISAGVAEGVDFGAYLSVDGSVHGSARRFSIQTGLSATGNLLIQPSGQASIELGPASDYRMLEIVYDPTADKADVLVDGAVVLAGYAGQPAATTRVIFGANQSSARARSRWNLVEFETGPDSDGDGLSNVLERSSYGTDPYDADSDDDGLTDGAEVAAGLDPLDADSDDDGLLDGFEDANGFDPTTAGEEGLDSDGDGLTNLDEQSHGSDPHSADSDGDGLSDGEEVNSYGTDPTKADSDGDGLTDSDEIGIYGTNPTLLDSDADGLSDGSEVTTHGTDPTWLDTDGDGLNDGDEIARHGTDPTDADSDDDGLLDGFEVAAGFDPLVAGEADQDPDGDGLDNLGEQAHGADPHLADTDGDGLSDGAEVTLYGTNPASQDSDGDGLLDPFEIQYGFDPNAAGDGQQDPDLDGLRNLEEQSLGTLPLAPDSDLDGVSDGDEVRIYGSDPNVPDGGELPVAASAAMTFTAVDQPLFADLQDAPDTLTVIDQSYGPITQGRIETVPQGVPLEVVQKIWDQALDTCNNTRSGATRSYCSDWSYTPSDAQCISGGNVDIGNVSISCCVTVLGYPDTGADYPNCGFWGAASFTINYVNSTFNAGISTSYNVGSGIGPRPTVAPPPQPFQVGALVTTNVNVQAKVEFNRDKQDGGLVDLDYATTATLHSNRSSVAAGDSFVLTASHAPRQQDSGMRSEWPAESLWARYDFDVSADADVEYASMDPVTGNQVHQTVNMMNTSAQEGGELVGFRAGLLDGLELRFMNGVSYAPDGYRDQVFGIPPLPPGTGLDLSFTNPVTCPSFIFSLFPPCSTFPPVSISSDLAAVRFQIPETASPVGEDFKGGAVAFMSSTPVVPERSEIEADGKLVNTVPSRYRPVTNFTNETPLSQVFFGNTSELSADYARFEIDIDGLLGLVFPPFVTGLNFKVNKLLSIGFDVLDSDAVVWLSYDQKLAFDPNLVADVTFSKDVEIWNEGSQSFQPVSAGTPVTLAVRPAGDAIPQHLSDLGIPPSLEVKQPPGGVAIDVTYSFRYNLFDNQTYPLTTLAWQNTILQLQAGGLIGTALSAAGLPFGFQALRYTQTLPEPVKGNRMGSADPFTGAANDFPGAGITVLDLAFDSDGDGLPDSLESVTCSDPLDADSDDDGLPDGIEDANRNGLLDPGETNGCLADTDGDGLQDGTERGLVGATPDPDGAGPASGTNLAVFIPDGDPTTTTDATKWDSDGDGFSDGAEAQAGTDPNDPGSIPSSPHPVPSLSPEGVGLLIGLLAALPVWLGRLRRRGGRRC